MPRGFRLLWKGPEKVREFNKNDLKRLYKPASDSTGEDNGQVTIIGGSKLFHGAPILSLKVASRMVDMVFFASPESSVGGIAERIKSKLLSFIWVPWDDVEQYIKKSDAVLIGPGFMRFGSERNKDHELKNGSEDGTQTRRITEHLLKKFPNKRWVIDAGSLQTMDPGWIPQDAIVTPNKKEFELLFKVKIQSSKGKSASQNLKIVQEKATRYNCIIVLKSPETIVASIDKTVLVKGGNAGLTKGGTGDVLAGVTLALLAKNEPFLAACAGSYILKASADELYKKVGVYYNADDLANRISKTVVPIF